jgi:hypothetical protein
MKTKEERSAKLFHDIRKKNNNRENVRGNQEWTIQRHMQYWSQDTNKDKQNKKHYT